MTVRRHARLGRGGALAAICVAALFAIPARADVLEIGADGSTAIQVGAGASRTDDTSSLTSDSPDDVAGASDLPTIPVPARRQPPSAYVDALAQVATRYKLSPALLEALVWQESRWQPGAVSRVGAIGLTQLMPQTAQALGVDPRDPLANLDGGARFLRLQLDRFGGNVEKALAAYNAGPARVAKAGGVPAIAETRAYVAAILARLNSNLSGD